MNERAKRILKRNLVLLAIGLAYVLWVRVTGIGIPCLFYTVTGLKCPGCGISRMLLSLLRLDFRAAFRYNPFLLLTSPILMFLLIESDLQYVRNKRRKTILGQVLLWGEIVGLLAYGIIRNIL